MEPYKPTEPVSETAEKDETEAPLEDSDDEHSDEKPPNAELAKQEKQSMLVRRMIRKWWRLAGIAGHPESCDQLGEGDFMVNWTKAIAPQLEGRIKIAAS
ncbi:hypothetical protein LTS18_014251 [Coniosporium uncinatum]|uniref:Uncharacterized protein n=1 Tax=Coniosporium uncinatum TaxID=93489 RepID=A0ACC3DHK2_9PEZI|nr:hypothetical protein LTS18_014251 [Coniosporium uncinatum]